MSSPSTTLSIVQLAFFIFCTPFLIYCLFVNRRHIFGWVFLFLFTNIRLVGAALAISNPTSNAAQIISSVAVSPLLAAVAGIIHQSSPRARTKSLATFQTAIHIVIHLTILSAIALLIVGNIAYNDASKTADEHSTAHAEILAGILIVLTIWVLMVALLVLPYRSKDVRREMSNINRRLVTAVAVAMPFLLLRLLYLLVVLLDTNETNSVGLKAGMSAMPEFVISLVLGTAGILARNRRHGDEVRNSIEDQNFQLTENRKG